MTAAGEAGEPTAIKNAWLRQIDANVRAAIALSLRSPRHEVATPSLAQIAVLTLVAVVAVIATMALFDAWAIVHARRLPEALHAAAGRFTDLGKSGWFLWPIGIVLAAVVIFDSPTAPRFARRVLAAWAVRLGFVFIAIALPSLFDTVGKRLIGRSRPFVDGLDVWAYHPLSWQPKFASFPSGHTATAFAALVAIGAIFPQARALLWIYAVLIGLSRVVITAHHPSDVIAGAIVGVAGALLVRHWFAARRLGFLVRPDGTVQAMPGPSLRRITKAVARRLHSA
jgi:membrane-associated phospholipid phosphatase